MQIILVDQRWNKALNIDLSPKLILAAVLGLVIAVTSLSFGLYVLTLRVGAVARLPGFEQLVAVVMHDELARKDQFVRDNVTVMAKKLGAMQAQLLRLDALGERVAKIAGVRPEEFNFRDAPGRGGPEIDGARPWTLAELHREVSLAEKQVDSRADYMNVVESELLAARVRQALLPHNTPVVEGFVGSGFGMRADPFTGQLAMHSGVDFAAPGGTAIYAAAGGVVESAEMHPSYGNTVKINHGNDVVTLYAHASKLLVKPGDIVKRGQLIAAVGTTGRSTGPHLHFEVHVKGTPQNPWRFLAQQKPGSPLATVAATVDTDHASPKRARSIGAAARAPSAAATASAETKSEDAASAPVTASAAAPAPAPLQDALPYGQ